MPDFNPHQRLTPREIDVLKEMALGLSNNEIGMKLHLAVGTVKQHASHVMRKLGVSSRSGAVSWAWQHGVIAESKTTQLMAYEILRLCPDCISPIEKASDVGVPCVEHLRMIVEALRTIPLRDVINL